MVTLALSDLWGKKFLILQLSEMVGYGTETKLSSESVEIIARA
ncbi:MULTISPECIES: hypothetical protein [Aerosakkonema]